MNGKFDLSYLGVMVDLAGCPNCCRHCWLGSHKNGNLGPEAFVCIAQMFQNWRNEDGQGISELGFFSWWREPDYREDYRRLWELEQALSSPGRAQRFELLSTWRLARDEGYAKWAAALPTKACQISFFGMEENTDWGMRRKGAFQDQLLAARRCLDAGIAPRFQLFLTKRCLHELEAFAQMMERMELDRRCRQIGSKFEMFLGGISPEGNGYELEDVRMEEGDLMRIPGPLLEASREGAELLGQPEDALLEELKNETQPPNMDAAFPCLAVNARYDVYPNNAEPAPWWRLGNLISDGVDGVLRAYMGQTPPGMRANRSVPIGELAGAFGNPKSKKLYHKGDLVCRFVHQWGMEQMKGKKNI